MRLVMIEWVDACSDSIWVTPVDELHCAKVVSVGFLVGENSEEAILALSKADYGHRSGRIAIPKCSIKRMRKLGVNNGQGL